MLPSLGSSGLPGGRCLWLALSPQDSNSFKAQTGFNLGAAGWKYHPAGGGARRLGSNGLSLQQQCLCRTPFAWARCPVISCGICHAIPIGSPGSDADWSPLVAS